ncbi:MAG: ComF family protein [Actinomycetota bacterium]
MALLELLALGAPPRCAGCRRRGEPLCGVCRDGLGSARIPVVPGVDHLLVAWPYEAGARSLVLDLKLRGDRGAAVPLARELVAEVAARGLAAEVLTWVPGKPRENRGRGFDHAGVLAAEIGARLGLPVAPLLTRRGKPLDQTSLGAAERWANLRGAFAAEMSPPRVALVDDLVTTGATAAACAEALRRAGAGRVEVLAACSA